MRWSGEITKIKYSSFDGYFELQIGTWYTNRKGMGKLKMKKNILIILSVILLITIGLLYCSNQGKEKIINDNSQSNIEETAQNDPKEVVWRQLPTKQKDRIDGSWQDGKVSKITLNENSMMSPAIDKSYIGKEVYLIEFPTKDINGMPIYADINNLNIIGYGLVD